MPCNFLSYEAFYLQNIFLIVLSLISFVPNTCHGGVVLHRTIQKCSGLLRSQITRRENEKATRKLQLQVDAKKLLEIKGDARKNGWSLSQELVLSQLSLRYCVPTPEPLPNIVGDKYGQIDENDRWANLILHEITQILKKYRTDRPVGR